MSGTENAQTHTLSALSFQGMPHLGSAMIRENGSPAEAWYRLFVSIYSVTLAGLPVLPSGVVAGNPNSLTLANLSGLIQTQDTQINNGANAIAQNTSSIASLQSNVIILQQEINALTAQITALQNRVASLEGRMDGASIGGVSGGGATPTNTRGFLDLVVNGTTYRVALF